MENYKVYIKKIIENTCFLEELKNKIEDKNFNKTIDIILENLGECMKYIEQNQEMNEDFKTSIKSIDKEINIIKSYISDSKDSETAVKNFFKNK